MTQANIFMHAAGVSPAINLPDAEYAERRQWIDDAQDAFRKGEGNIAKLVREMLADNDFQPWDDAAASGQFHPDKDGKLINTMRNELSQRTKEQVKAGVRETALTVSTAKTKFGVIQPVKGTGKGRPRPSNPNQIRPLVEKLNKMLADCEHIPGLNDYRERVNAAIAENDLSKLPKEIKIVTERTAPRPVEAILEW